MSVSVKSNLQLYAQTITVEHEGTDCLVTLDQIDLAEIVGQVTIADLLDNYDYSEIMEYLIQRKAEDEE